jgi:hypothetical protein
MVMGMGNSSCPSGYLKTTVMFSTSVATVLLKNLPVDFVCPFKNLNPTEATNSMTTVAKQNIDVNEVSFVTVGIIITVF